MSDHNSPLMLDEQLALTGDVCCLYGKWGNAYVVYCPSANRPLYYHLADYRVTASVSGGGLVLIPRN